MTEAIHFGNDFNSSVASLRPLDALRRNRWRLSIGITGGIHRNTHRTTLLIVFALCALCAVLLAQNAIVPKPPLTAKDADRGMALYKAQWKARNEVTDFVAPLEPFKIAGNLYGLMALPLEMKWEEKIARLRMEPKLFIDRGIFPAITAAREVSFMQTIAKVKAAGAAASAR